VANAGSALFGGFCVTGTIARTATNVRAGAHGPLAGMLHAVFLLVFMLVAAPLAAFIPLAALAGVLAVVSWNMIEKSAIATLVRSGRGDAAVLGVTFFLTIFRNLTEAIVVGFALGSVLFMQRMSRAVAVETAIPFVSEDVADDGRSHDEARAADPGIVIYRITGVLFFGAAASIKSVPGRISDGHRALIVDFAAVPFLDPTGANVIGGLARKAHKGGARLHLAGAGPEIRKGLDAHGVRGPGDIFSRSVTLALQAEKMRASPVPQAGTL
ncbi:MAG: STAS domain-containing protein, partial [Rhodobacter sp.]|nr:STAS domain-containing protein [Rhodobacter sp.]